MDYEIEDLGLSSVERATVTRSGACFRKGLPIIASHYRYWNKVAQHIGIAYVSMLRRPIVDLDPGKTYCIGHNLWSAGYYHWMTEAVPRLLRVAKRSRDVTVLIPPFPRLAAVVDATVGPIGFKGTARYPEGANVRVGRLLLPDNPRRYGEYDVAALHEARDLYWNCYAPGAGAKAGRRIYVTRAKARGRRILNEDVLVALLVGKGFEIVAFEDLSFPQQVALMRETSVFVSIHGAGLTNIMFMPEGGTVVEIVQDPAEIVRRSSVRRSRLAQSVYCRMASVMGLSYFVNFGRSGVAGIPTLDTDIVVDVHELGDTVDAAIAYAAVA